MRGDHGGDRPLETPVWLLMGATGSVPGVLRAARGRLALRVTGRGALGPAHLRVLERRLGTEGLAEQLAAGRELVLFDVPVEKVEDVRFPWYNFGAGMKLKVGGAGFRLSFVRPGNTAGDPGLAGIAPSRANGRLWKDALAAATG
ncbi:hypothetical protein [Actinomadura kijaniata]|uniref:hypothetical protein n=1 Tax=Actinomadura kijaniata TaxID=46161 RepID=UPI000831D4B8|nr:hypothetical protein [Actinomadura kijaniata]